ncbi:MAG: siderophore ferric iron reductase [Cellvibrionaceae bacterium]|nr:siderophore ferric iron reductase [Cellvibrionaceae bacterium]
MMTERLFSLARRYHSALQGRELQATAAMLAPYANIGPPLRALYQHWQQHAPEAGPAYWAARVWSLLIWQPVYVLLLAVHGCGHGLNLRGFYQYYHQGSVAGFSLQHPEQIPTAPTCETQLIHSAAQQLQAHYQWLLAQCQGVFNLRRKLATRLTADTLLSGLIRLPVVQPARKNSELERLASQWLDALGWEGESALISIPLENALPALALNRKSCCFEYCRADGTRCSTCPKQPLQLRIQRIKAEHSA